MRKSYAQSCPLSRALDVLGERWTLLVVRELLTGPKRYGELLEGLPGLGTNLLAARLRQLEAAGLLRARRPLYELTPGGRDLAPALVELARWGLAHTDPPPPEESRGAVASPMALQALFDPGRAAAERVCCTFRVAGEVFHAVADRGQLRVGSGPALDSDVAVTLGARAYRRLEAGLSPRRLLATGELEIEGSLAALETLRQCFRRPTSDAPGQR